MAVIHLFLYIFLLVGKNKLKINYGKNKLSSYNGGINKAMRATGIVRRIDDLGRVVIPKEIRKTLRIR